MNGKYFQRILIAVLTTVLGFEWSIPAPASSQIPYELAREAQVRPFPSAVAALVDSALKHNHDRQRLKSIQDLRAIMASEAFKKSRSLFRGLVHQWLAINYFAFEDSADLVTYHVRRSLEEEIDVWPEHLEIIVPGEMRLLYQQATTKIVNDFGAKRKSVRLGVGPITRLDFAWRVAKHWDVAVGLGKPLLLAIKEPQASVFKFKTQSLVFLRTQRVRKNIGRLMAGLYVELAFALQDSIITKPNLSKAHPVKILSGGPILGYAYRSGWEWGGTFGVAQLATGRGNKIAFSSKLFSDGKTASLSYVNLEVYIRKWF